MNIGIRELRSRLSEVLDRAAAGERVVITDRGKPKAVLSAAVPADNIELGVAEGWISPPSTPDAKGAPVPARRFALQPGWTTERSIAEDRGI